MSTKSVIGGLAGGGIGWFFGGPIGAGVGALLGYVAGKWSGGSDAGTYGPTSGIRDNGAWAVVQADKAPGDYKWFDALAQKTKPSITFKAGLIASNGAEFITLKGTMLEVGVVGPGGARYWIVRQDSDLSMLDPTGADKLPPKGTVWRLNDADIVSGDNSGDTLKDAAGG